MTVVVPEDVAEVIRERGGSLYIWTHVHGVCEGRVTFLDVAGERPDGVSPPFERLEAGDLDIFLAIGAPLRPEFVELELHGRKKQIRAYWDRTSFGRLSSKATSGGRPSSWS